MEAPVLSSYFIPVSQIRKQRLPSPGPALEQRSPPGGLRPRPPGCLGAWKPEKPDGLSVTLAMRGELPSCLSARASPGPATPTSSQTQLSKLNRAIVVPATRTPSWPRLVRNHGSPGHVWPRDPGSAHRASLSVHAPGPVQDTPVSGALAGCATPAGGRACGFPSRPGSGRQAPGSSPL